ncbi:MAG: LytTR family transcriptional regulator DNA-binding domain-containing protein [Ginsengibacter sp.]
MQSQYLVNLDHIKKYVRSEGNYLIMSDDENIPVARNQKERLMEKFGWL